MPSGECSGECGWGRIVEGIWDRGLGRDWGGVMVNAA